MITTKYGSAVEIINAATDDGILIVKRKSDGKIFDCHETELRADNGFSEIFAAIEEWRESNRGQG